LIELYQDPGLNMLDVTTAARATRVYQQLWRNLTFAELDGPRGSPQNEGLSRQSGASGLRRSKRSRVCGLSKAPLQRPVSADNLGTLVRDMRRQSAPRYLAAIL
jgi:hypothetical protein